ncbi:hypothetical protein ACH5RR_011315 [Cinchona calisaya]|uniref:Uncharacterized protein n=1 Tax=Cinchona calisaya TaxID=153742 RepID=A0ABD3A4M0_9GENT
MVPGQDNSTSTTVNRWNNSPLPYLFGGLAVMLGLIAVALITLACSYRKYPGFQPSSETENDIDDQEDKPPRAALEMEPRIVVIMAGDQNPTYLAKPTTPVIRQLDQV